MSWLGIPRDGDPMWMGIRRIEFLSEEACYLHGGHCFEGDGHVLASDPPQYPQTCKHCNKKRIAVPREAWEYRDVSG